MPKCGSAAAAAKALNTKIKAEKIKLDLLLFKADRMPDPCCGKATPGT